ncbi:hypothetical protein [Actibacterium sp. D379-3]
MAPDLGDHFVVRNGRVDPACQFLCGTLSRNLRNYQHIVPVISIDLVIISEINLSMEHHCSALNPPPQTGTDQALTEKECNGF